MEDSIHPPRIESADQVVGHHAKAVADLFVHMVGRPELDDVKKSKKGKDGEDGDKAVISQKGPGDTHPHHFVDHNPVGIFGLFSLLDMVHHKRGQKGHDEHPTEKREGGDMAIEGIEERDRQKRGHRSRGQGNKPYSKKTQEENLETMEKTGNFLFHS